MRVIAGPEKKTRVMSEKERRITAYHEMGHAIVGHYLEHSDPVHKISVIGRGQALGYTISMPTEDRFLTTRAELTDSMAMTLGGRAAEEIVFGEITTGASNDIEKVTATAKQMVMRYGMSERLGPRVFGHDHRQPFLGREFSSEPDYSDEIAREIDDEIRRVVESAHQRAKDILTEHRETLNTVSEILVRRETIEKDEFEALLAGQPEEDVFPEEAADAAAPAARRRRPTARPRRAAHAAPPRPRRRPRGPRGRAAQARALAPLARRRAALRRSRDGCAPRLIAGRPSRSSWASSTSRPTRSPTAARGSTRRPRSRTGASSSREGAAILDVGGESTRPGAEPVTEAEELRRVVPVLEGLAGAGARLSIDTSKAAVAAAALDAGATIVNDVTALRGDPAMAGARRRARLRRLPHAHARRAAHDAARPALRRRRRRRQGVPRRAPARSRSRAGIAEERVWLDPGIGFGKTIDHNLELLRRLDELVALGRPLVVGTSRKSFLGTITGREPRERVAGDDRHERPRARPRARASSASTTSPRRAMRSLSRLLRCAGDGLRETTTTTRS